MADAVTNKTVIDVDKFIEIHLTNISDGTGESAVTKADPATVQAFSFDGLQPQYFAIMEVIGMVSGFTSVQLLWNANTPVVAAVLAPGFNRLDFSQAGGLYDPQATGWDGKIKLTTAGASSSATYDITILLKKSRSRTSW